MLWVYIVAGLGLLVVGGDFLVRGAVAAATRLGVSPLLIGIALVGFGTSAPELVTSLEAALRGSPGVAIGNVVGSNIANILLILGVSALLWPVAVDRRGLKRDGTVLMIATAIVFAVLALGEITRPMGIVFIAGLFVYLFIAYRGERDSGGSAEASGATDETEAPAWSLPVALLVAALALGMVVLGARLLVDGAIELARLAGISETVIGLTVVAVGTSLPELVTSVMAAIRRQSAVAFGNVIGSNIYNVLFILGVTATVKPLEVPADFGWVDLSVFAGSAIALIVFSITGAKVCRKEGAILLAAYVAYMGWLAVGQVQAAGG